LCCVSHVVAVVFGWYVHDAVPLQTKGCANAANATSLVNNRLMGRNASAAAVALVAAGLLGPVAVAILGVGAVDPPESRAVVVGTLASRVVVKSPSTKTVALPLVPIDNGISPTVTAWPGARVCPPRTY
jgi:hypothetical protein